MGSTDGAFPGYENAGGEDVLLALVYQGDWQDARAIELLRVPWPPPRPTTPATATPTQLLLTTLSDTGRYFCVVGDAGSTGAQGMSDTLFSAVSDCGG